MACALKRDFFQKGKKHRLASLASFRGELLVFPGEQVDDGNLLTPTKTGFESYRQLNQTCTIFPHKKDLEKSQQNRLPLPSAMPCETLTPFPGSLRKKRKAHHSDAEKLRRIGKLWRFGTHRSSRIAKT